MRRRKWRVNAIIRRRPADRRDRAGRGTRLEFDRPRSAQRGLNFVRANCARCHAIDRVSPEPARDRAAIPRAAQALPGREPAGSVRRGDPDRTSEHAGIPARTGSDRRRDRLPQDAGTIERREAPRLISIKCTEEVRAIVPEKVGRRPDRRAGKIMAAANSSINDLRRRRHGLLLRAAGAPLHLVMREGPHARILVPRLSVLHWECRCCLRDPQPLLRSSGRAGACSSSTASRTTIWGR